MAPGYQHLRIKDELNLLPPDYLPEIRKQRISIQIFQTQSPQIELKRHNLMIMFWKLPFPKVHQKQGLETRIQG